MHQPRPSDFNSVLEYYAASDRWMLEQRRIEEGPSRDYYDRFMPPMKSLVGRGPSGSGTVTSVATSNSVEIHRPYMNEKLLLL